jgi:dynein heavy chain, axonemal
MPWLQTCVSMLKAANARHGARHGAEYNEIPFDTLAYTCGECNYGGKVTDAHDRHTLMVVLDSVYTPSIIKDGYRFCESGLYYAPEHTDHEGYLDFIAQLPILSEPEAFGMHENANINKDLQEVELLLTSLMLTQSRDSSSSTKTQEELLAEVSADILRQLPENFDIEEAQRKYPQDYHESMNTVLIQELNRFNALLSAV